MSTTAHDHQHHASPAPANADGSPSVGATVDPVCGMRVALDAPESESYLGTLFRFCSMKCAEAFRKEPAKYIKSASAPAKAAPEPAGVIYTCPMHPQIR